MIITDLFESRRLHVGDPIIVIGPNEYEGKTGEVTELGRNGAFVVVQMYNGETVSMHSSDVEYNEYADEQDADEFWDEEDGYEETLESSQDQGVAEGNPSPKNKAQGAIGHGLPWKNYSNPDELAQDISDKILTITNIVKFLDMAYDSTIYRALERYFEKYGYPESVFNRVASIVFKRLDDEGRRLSTDPRVQEQEVAEGWSDAMVSRRTGQPRTSYSVYIKGKKWKDFENDDHAEAVANKLRAKFKADGRDPSVITVAPTDYDKDMKEAISKKDLLKQVGDRLNDPEFKKQPADPTKRWERGDLYQGPGPDDYGYTGYQGHGMPTDRAEQARIRADKKKGMAEGSRGSAIQQGQRDYARGLSKQQNPYFKSDNGKTPPAAYDWEAGWDYARDAGKKQGVEEEWSKKYKDSINCSNPKGFSQKAHCDSKKKNEDTIEKMLDENLRKWFKDKWVRFGPDGKIRGDCARGSESEGKPKCLPQAKAQALGKKGRASAAAKKRREDPNPERRGKAKNVATKVKEEQLDEKCWDGYKKQGMKKKGDRMVPNCVPKESIEETQTCPDCGGPMYNETVMMEKKDACYYKVKASAKIWPSAYASGRLVQCRKKGAKNYGNKKESVAEEMYRSQFKSKEDAIAGAKERVKTFRDPIDGIEIWAMPDGGFDQVHTMNANGRNHCIKNGGKKLGTVYQSKPEKKSVAEGGVDQLEQRRIADLNDRMDGVMARISKEKIRDPDVLAILMKQYNHYKDERDSYYKIRESKKKEISLKSRDPNYLTLTAKRTSGASGSHVNKKRDQQQGKLKHKAQELDLAEAAKAKTVAKLAPAIKLFQATIRVKMPDYTGLMDVNVTAQNINMARQMVKAMYNIQNSNVVNVKEVKALREGSSYASKLKEWTNLGFAVSSDYLWPAELMEQTNSKTVQEFSNKLDQYRNSLDEPRKGAKCILAFVVQTPDLIYVIHGDATYQNQTDNAYVLKGATGQLNNYTKKDRLIFDNKNSFDKFITWLQLSNKSKDIDVKVEEKPVLENTKDKDELNPGEYYIWRVYFDDGSSKRIKVTSSDFDPYKYYAKKNQNVINVDFNWEKHK